MQRRIAVGVVVFLALLVTGPDLGAQQILTNADVLKMAEAKLGDAVIVAKIRSSATRFDTSTEALIELKKAGLSDSVLEAMTSANTQSGVMPLSGVPQSKPIIPVDPNDPLAEHDPGIYLNNQQRETRALLQIDPSTYSQARTGGILASGLTYGIAKAKWKAVIRGTRATVRSKDVRPTFYFYFEKKSGSLSYAATWMAWFAGITSPNQFTLAKFDVKREDREIVVGEFGTFGSSMGTRAKDTIAFTHEKLAPGIYKVTPQGDLKPGEYCFFFTGTNAAMGQGGTLFDFGIDQAQ